MPTVFENYTASFEIDKQRIELNMWDTSGKTRFSAQTINGPPQLDRQISLDNLISLEEGGDQVSFTL